MKDVARLPVCVWKTSSDYLFVYERCRQTTCLCMKNVIRLPVCVWKTSSDYLFVYERCCQNTCLCMKDVVRLPVCVWKTSSDYLFVYEKRHQSTCLCMKDVVRIPVSALKIEGSSSRCKILARDVSENATARIVLCHLLHIIWSGVWPCKHDLGHNIFCLCFHNCKGIVKRLYMLIYMFVFITTQSISMKFWNWILGRYTVWCRSHNVWCLTRCL
jgi:hypothetical protein